MCAPTTTVITEDEYKCAAINQGNVTIGQLVSTWNNSDCPQVFQNILYTQDDGRLGYNSSKLNRVQADIDNLMQTYLSLGYEFTSTVTSSKYNPFQENILELCRSQGIPGGCDLFLQNYCQQFSYDDLADNATVASLCGCYVQSPYYNLSTAQGNLAPQCQPVCHLTSTVQISDPCTGITPTCDNTVCIIDNVNVSLVNTTTNTAFQQICPGCDQPGQNPCTCIIGGENITDTVNGAGGAVTYSQYCGSNAQCFILEPDETLLSTTCPVPEDFSTGNSGYTFPFLIACIVSVVVVVSILVFIANRNSYGQ